MREDSKEQIKGCLSCKKKSCTNCLAYKQTNEYHKPGPKAKAVIAFGTGEEEMLFDSAADAADFLNVHPGSIKHAIYVGGRCRGYYWRYADEQ